MSLDSTTDPLIATIAALVRAHVNGATAAELGENAIVALYKHPDILPIAPQAELPCLSVHRGQERGLSVSSTHLDQRVQIVLDYVSPACAFDRLGDRWPLLNLVWREALRAIRLGYSSHYSSGARVLDDVGVMFFFPTSIQKVDRFADGEGRAFPAFRAMFDLQVREDVTLPAQDFSSLFASIDLVPAAAEGDVIAGHVRALVD